MRARRAAAFDESGRFFDRRAARCPARPRRAGPEMPHRIAPVY
jgi:hypothetical protein